MYCGPFYYLCAKHNVTKLIRGSRKASTTTLTIMHSLITLAITTRTIIKTLARESQTGRVKTRFPSFADLKPASVVSSRTKKSNRSQGTKHELLLMRELKHIGLHFKHHVKNLPGKPDIVFPRQQVIIFCDGDFWHGRNWRARWHKLIKGTNGKYWKAKIGSNIERDKIVNETLKTLGWKVVRVWETDIKSHTQKIAQQIFRAVK